MPSRPLVFHGDISPLFNYCYCCYDTCVGLYVGRIISPTFLRIHSVLYGKSLIYIIISSFGRGLKCGFVLLVN